MTLPALSRIGAALSSMGTSRPSFVTSAVSLARATTRFFAENSHHQVFSRPMGLLVDDSEDFLDRLAQGLLKLAIRSASLRQD